MSVLDCPLILCGTLYLVKPKPLFPCLSSVYVLVVFSACLFWFMILACPMLTPRVTVCTQRWENELVATCLMPHHLDITKFKTSHMSWLLHYFWSKKFKPPSLIFIKKCESVWIFKVGVSSKVKWHESRTFFIHFFFFFFSFVMTRIPTQIHIPGLLCSDCNIIFPSEFLLHIFL